ncbi:hypothetical protein Hanom_Chr01g00040311 [Helianthus anomalus]
MNKNKHKHTRVHRLTLVVLMQMKVSVTSTVFTNLTCKLSKCVCGVSDRMPSRTLSFCLFYLSLCSLPKHYTCMGIYIPSIRCLVEGSDRWSEGSSIDHDSIEGSVLTSKDHLSRSIIRSLSFDDIEGSTISFDWLSFDIEHLSTSFNCCPSQTGGWLTWSTYNTNQDTVYIMTEYRESTDTSAPTVSGL